MGLLHKDCPIQTSYITMNRKSLLNPKKILGTAVAATTVVSLGMLAAPSHAASISVMSFADGTGITSNSSEVSTAITPVVEFTTVTNLDQDGQVIVVGLTGMSVVGTLDATTVTFSGGTLEAAPGTADNGSHELSVTGTELTISLDSNTGTPPSIAADAYTISVAAGNLESSATAGNYQQSIYTSHDSGAFLYYVGNGNDVVIRGRVENTLAFVIRDAADTADQANVDGLAVGPNLCQLTPDPMATTTVSTCDYRLKVTTNAQNGYAVSYASSANNFTNGTHVMTNAAAGGVDVVAGTEAYGAVLAEGASSVVGSTVTRGATFTGTATDTFPVDATTASEMYSVSGSNSPAVSADTTNTALVTHEAAIEAGTPAGIYTQTVTYTVTATF